MTDGVQEKGVVTAVDAEGNITIAFARRTQCQNCPGGCLQSGEQMLLTITSQKELKAGEQVVVSLKKGAVLKASLLAYGVPLIAFIGGILAGGLFISEAAGLIAGILAAVAAFFLVGRVTRSKKRKPQWTIERL